jgi:hypothetical protein
MEEELDVSRTISKRTNLIHILSIYEDLLDGKRIGQDFGLSLYFIDDVQNQRNCIFNQNILKMSLSSII